MMQGECSKAYGLDTKSTPFFSTLAGAWDESHDTKRTSLIGTVNQYQGRNLPSF